MLLTDPGADLLGLYTTRVLQALRRTHPSPMNITHLGSAADLPRSRVRTSLDDLTDLGLVTVTIKRQTKLYSINTQHIAWPGVLLLLDSREKVIKYVQRRCETLAPLTTIVALCLPSGEGPTSGVRFVAVHDNEVTAIDLLRDVLLKEVAVLVGRPVTVDVVGRSELETRVAANDATAVETWFRSITVHGDDLSRLILDLVPAKSEPV